MQLYVYASLGEVDESSKLSKKINEKWVIAKNPAWKSDVMDATNADWRHFFIKKIVTPLLKKGYRGIFLDTADSYMLGAKTPKAREAQEAGLVKMIKSIHAHFPQVKILMNRGFDIVPQVHQFLSGLVAESLFRGWNPNTEKYNILSKQDNNYLITQLTHVKNKYHLPIIVISYLPKHELKQALSVSHKIEKLGFIPWITNHTLTAEGVSDHILTSRRVLFIFHDKSREDIYGENSPGFQYLAMPLEYLGYVPIMYNSNYPMNNNLKETNFAGIVFFVDAPPETYSKRFMNWIVSEKKLGVPILFFDGFPFKKNANNYKKFGLSIIENSDKLGKLKLSPQQKHIGYEIKPLALPTTPSFFVKSTTQSWLSLISQNKKNIPVIGITPWGGYVMSEYGYWLSENSGSKWIVDPFALLTKSLRLAPLPVPDITTENGTRLMMAHIDGDGFVNRAEFAPKKFAAEIINTEILKHYKIPTTVSIVEGEIGPQGQYPKLSEEAEKIARIIFKPDYIELATHSYSHPFDWRVLEGTGKKSIHSTYNLPIKGYEFNLNREIIGSANYINKNLAPKGKHVQVFLWTGNADPSKKAVEMTYDADLMNMNGGMTIISKRDPSLTRVFPIGIYKGQYFQVYAPIGNEIYYTNDWTGPYFGFKNVIQTLKMTNTPLRLKPIDVYYHFYSGDKLASLNALKKIFNWTKTQKLMHIFVSTYTHKVLDFNNAVFSKTPNGWLVHTTGHLRELRIKQSQGYPDFTLSKNIIGFNDYHQVRYLHLGSQYRSKIVLTNKQPTQPYLISANEHATHWSESFDHKSISASFSGFDPLQLRMNNMLNCSIRLDKNKAFIEKNKVAIIKSSHSGMHHIEIKCPT